MALKMISGALPRVLAGILATVMLLTVGCEKEPFIPPFVAPPPPAPECIVDEYTCTVENTSTKTVNGTLRAKSVDGYLYGFIDDSDEDYIDFDFSDSYSSYDWGPDYYNMYFYGDGWPSSVTFQYGNNRQATIAATYGTGYKLTELELRHTSLLNTSSDKEFVIYDIAYDSKGNLKAYSYREQLRNSPYTVTIEEDYTIEYDTNKVHDKNAFINYKYFAISPRPTTLPSISFGDRFDPQAFSHNLVMKKEKVSDNTAVFINTYKFDGNGSITQHKQHFLNHGLTPSTVTWDYTYNCE